MARSYTHQPSLSRAGAYEINRRPQLRLVHMRLKYTPVLRKGCSTLVIRTSIEERQRRHESGSAA
jgi:hypothetical protein